MNAARKAEMEATRQWVEEAAARIPEEDWRLLRAAFGDLQLHRDPDTGETVASEFRRPERFGKENMRVSSVEGLMGDSMLAMGEFIAAKEGAWPWRKDFDGYPPEHRLELRLWRARLERLLTKLRPKRAELIAAHFFGGETLQDIASRKGVTYQAVQQQMDVAIADLRVALVNHGHELRDIPAEEL